LDKPGSLSLERLSLHFGGLLVLDAISLQIHPGELMALIGPNGAGKTSVLNCISGLYRPSDGRIVFEGRDITGNPPHAVADSGIARTFQHAGLFRRMTVLQNILIARHNHFCSNTFLDGVFWGRTRRDEIAQRDFAEEIIEFFELEKYRDHLVAGIPFGVQKIVGFARALAMEPRLLLLDEPSAGLNRESKETLARFILRIRQEKRTSMIWVEHDMQMVADLADRIYVIDYGRYITEGPPQDVLSDSKVIEIYLGTKTE
jgi:branched-chain amino acid transport system ATP-binding protein